MSTGTFLPDYVLQALRDCGDAACERAGAHTLDVDDRLLASGLSRAPQPAPSEAAWEIYDAGNDSALPGELVRSAGEPDAGDPAVDEAALGVTESLALFADLGRDSYDDAGATVVSTVHYENDYNNASWDGHQLIFGDGDGKLFNRFTAAIDVVGHELAHGVTQYASGFVYRGQPGALNESMSDVFGACIRQRHLDHTAEQADWLIGAGLFTDEIDARALRSMKEPGTAYDDPRIGKDPQPGHMDDYVHTVDDHGGVHINSGIPNRAFSSAAIAIGGMSWECAGRIWYDALTSGLSPTTDFVTFAEATIAVAGEHVDAVTAAWREVGVVPGADREGDRTVPDGVDDAAETVAVTRSGGFAGLVERGRVDLHADDPRARQAASIVARIDFRQVRMAAAAVEVEGADYFVYDFRYSTVRVSLPEPALTEELKQLASVVLGI